MEPMVYTGRYHILECMSDNNEPTTSTDVSVLKRRVDLLDERVDSHEDELLEGQRTTRELHRRVRDLEEENEELREMLYAVCNYLDVEVEHVQEQISDEVRDRPGYTTPYSVSENNDAENPDWGMDDTDDDT